MEVGGPQPVKWNPSSREGLGGPNPCPVERPPQVVKGWALHARGLGPTASRRGLRAPSREGLGAPLPSREELGAPNPCPVGGPVVKCWGLAAASREGLVPAPSREGLGALVQLEAVSSDGLGASRPAISFRV